MLALCVAIGQTYTGGSDSDRDPPGLERDDDTSDSDIEEVTKPSATVKEKAGKAQALGPKVNKAYKVAANPYADPTATPAPCRRNAHLGSATTALTNISDFLAPVAAEERDATRALNQLQLHRINTLQNELSEARR